MAYNVAKQLSGGAGAQEDAFVDQAVSEQSENILAEPNKAAFSNLQRGMIDEFEALKQEIKLKEAKERWPSGDKPLLSLRDRAYIENLENIQRYKGSLANLQRHQDDFEHSKDLFGKFGRPFGSPSSGGNFGGDPSQGNIDSTMLNQDPLGVLDPGNIPQEGVGGNKNNRSQGGKQ